MICLILLQYNEAKNANVRTLGIWFDDELCEVCNKWLLRCQNTTCSVCNNLSDK